MKEQTIYSYKLLYRFHWRVVGYTVQLVIAAALLAGFSLLWQIPVQELLISLSIVAVLPALHFLLLRFYAYSVSSQLKVTPDSLISPWWGAGTRFPVSLSFFRRAELTVCLGNLLVTAVLFVWLPLSYALALIIGTVVLLVPRLLALQASFGKPERTRVTYGMTSVSFILTDG